LPAQFPVQPFQIRLITRNYSKPAAVYQNFTDFSAGKFRNPRFVILHDKYSRPCTSWKTSRKVIGTIFYCVIQADSSLTVHKNRRKQKQNRKKVFHVFYLTR
jgi:hypothetical protein